MYSLECILLQPTVIDITVYSSKCRFIFFRIPPKIVNIGFSCVFIFLPGVIKVSFHFCYSAAALWYL